MIKIQLCVILQVQLILKEKNSKSNTGLKLSKEIDRDNNRSFIIDSIPSLKDRKVSKMEGAGG